ncbi:MAG: phage portal protein, partial [Elusimicrobia bacterium]|nr:phage portal protein [Elusimicrobiota bacterium]
MPGLRLLFAVRGVTAMGLKNWIVKTFLSGTIREEVQKSSRQIVEYLTVMPMAEGILPETDLAVYEQAYQQTSWVRAAVNVIERAVTARGFELVPTKPDADPKNGEALQEFFDNCNPNDTLMELIGDLTRDDFIFGNAYLEVVYGADGKPKELWNLDTISMRVKADEHGNVMGYVQVPRFSIKVPRVEFAPREVVHFRLGSKGATLYGLSPLHSLVLPVTCDRFAMVYNRAFFLNGAKIRGAFIMKDATPEQVERNRDYLAARAKNPDMAHTDLVLEGQVDFKQIGTTQKDMEFLELRKFTRDEILAVYGVPPSKVSIIETGNIGAGTGEHQTQSFYEETIGPFQAMVAAKLTKAVIREGFGIMDWAFQFPKRAIDEKEQAEILSLYLANGVFTPEEVRRLVAPRMPEVQKAFENGAGEIFRKGRLASPRRVLVTATQSVVDLENQFLSALERLFRDIRRQIASALPALKREAVLPRIAKTSLTFETYQVPHHRILIDRIRFSEVAKDLDDVETLLAGVDKEKIKRVILRYTREAARRGARLSARRRKVEEPEELDLELEEELRNNAEDLGLQVSESLKDSLRRTLLEGILAGETAVELMRRVEGELDTLVAVEVRAVTDDLGNVLRRGHTRKIARNTLAEMIARTEASHAFNRGYVATLRKAGVRNLQWILASDACPKCVAEAEVNPGETRGKIVPVEEADGLLPWHFNCKCGWEAVEEA